MIRITRASLLSALSTVTPSSAPKSALEILDSVLVSPVATGLRLACTDGVTTATAEAAAEHDGESFAVVAKTFQRLVDQMPDGPLELKLGDGRVTVKGGKATARLPTREAADFPVIGPAPEGGIVVKAADLARILSATRHALGDRDRIPHDGTHVRCEMGKVTATAANGHVLARAWADCAKGKPWDAFVPSSGCAAILRVAESLGDADVTLARDDRRIYCAGISALLYDEAPPPGDVVLSRSAGAHEIRVGRADFLAAVKRAAVTVDEHAKLTIGCRGDTVMVSSASAAGDTGTEVGGSSPDNLEILVDAGYLLAQLQHVPDDEVRIVLRATDGLAPLLFQSAQYAGIVMPMRPDAR